jgi:outer membrane lipopolysaccharide assembly protein LptE/RlpB
MRNRFLLKGLGIVLLIAFLAGCGYHFKGKENNLPKDIKSISIPIFKNKTTETNIENLFTNALISQFVRSKEFKITDVDKADAIIYGVLTEYHNNTLTYAGGGKVSQYRVRVVAEITLVRAKTKEVIWRAKNLQEFADYNASTNTIENEANKQKAIRRLSRFMAEIIHDRMLENF